ncbi:hypothetical protein GOV10_02000, partial [Candidatus Woesearchaeota archaeon]|nr:hypothetical protein [Candidatus Woesearchaeota archaeon]
HYGYPNVNVGILNVEEYKDHDDPLKWSREGFEIPKIVDLRSSLINARYSLSVKSPGMAPPSGFSSRFLDITKEISISQKPADVELSLVKKPTFKLNFGGRAAPHGPNVSVKTAKLGGNTKVNWRLEKAASDTELKAAEAVTSLFRKGVDEHALTRAFSMGNFGLGRRRVLVPTRWSITAVDDTAGKAMITEVKRFQEGDCVAYFGGHLGNYYLIILFDDVWQYELYEQFVPQERRKASSQIVAEHDYESYTGRKDYAHETAGGYYATRLGILEKLHEMKRQASVLVIRIITEEYLAPLGVWVVREAVRKALATRPLRFGDRKLMLEYAKKMMQQLFAYDIDALLHKSEVVKNLTSQQKLKKFL